MNTILAQKREQDAKVKLLRRSGLIPAVICGASLKESISIQIDQKTIGQLKRTKRNGSKVNVQVEAETYPTLIKEIDYDGLKNEVLHISFQVLDANKIFNSVADIVLINKDKVTGVLEQMQMQIPHAAEPEHLIDTVTVNLENIRNGTTLTIGDIPEFQSDKIKLLADTSNIVLRIRDKKRAEVNVAE